MSVIDRSLAMEAIDLVTGDRNDDYGDPADDFARIAMGWAEIVQAPVDAEQVALMMVWLKVCREVNKPKRDNVVDAIGYLLTYDAVRAERDNAADLLKRSARMAAKAAPSWLEPTTTLDEQL